MMRFSMLALSLLYCLSSFILPSVVSAQQATWQPGDFIYRSDSRHFFKKSSLDDGKGALTLSNNACSPQISPDGDWIYYRFCSNDVIWRKSIHDISDGEIFISQQISYAQGFSVSPDGMHIFYVNNGDGYLYMKNVNEAGDGYPILTSFQYLSGFRQVGANLYYANPNMGNAIYKKSLVTSDDGDGVMVFDGQNYFDFNISPDEQYIYYTEPALGSHLMKKDLTISSSILDTTQLISNYVSSWSLSKDGSKVFYSDGMFIFSNDTNQPDYSIPLTSGTYPLSGFWSVSPDGVRLIFETDPSQGNDSAMLEYYGKDLTNSSPEVRIGGGTNAGITGSDKFVFTQDYIASNGVVWLPSTYLYKTADSLGVTYQNGSIIYTRTDGQRNIWVKSINDNSPGIKLTHYMSLYPKISRDKRFIVYMNHSEHILYRKSATDDDTGIPILPYSVSFNPNFAQNMTEFDISPDGEEVIYADVESAIDANGNDIILGKLHKKSIHDDSVGEVIAQATGISSPKFSPDGTKIAYVSGGSIFMKNATDTNDGDYVALGSNPSFSPDGTKIVYTNSGLLYEKVLSANGEGTQIIMPATFSDGSDDKPSYTEDGLSIVFSDYYDIYKRLVNDIDGSSLTLIASQSKYPVAWQGVYQAPGNQQTNTQDSTGQTNTGTTNTPIADIPGAECSPGAEQAGMTCSVSGTISTASCEEPTNSKGAKVFVYKSSALPAGEYKLFLYTYGMEEWKQVGNGNVQLAGSVGDAGTLGATTPVRNSDVNSSLLASGKDNFNSFLSGATSDKVFERKGIGTNFLERTLSKTSMGTEFLQFGTKNALFGDSINQVLFSYIAGKMSGHPMEFVAKDCAGNWKAQVSVNVVGIIDGDNNSTQFIKDRGEFTKIYK